jgi:hypothetical protein
MDIYNRFRAEAGRARRRRRHCGGDAHPADLGVGNVEHCVAKLTYFIREYGIVGPERKVQESGPRRETARPPTIPRGCFRECAAAYVFGYDASEYRGSAARH